MITLSALPIDEILPKLLATLENTSSAVLVAPPGAGKTTRVPVALLTAEWLAGKKILLLEPRRLAARAAANRMAATLGETVGQTVGIRARLDTRVSAKTRIEVVTEGVFARMILRDPALETVAAVLFDEFHERSLDADLGLALAYDAKSGLRPDLRLIVMSATLDPIGVSDLLGGAPVIECRGRLFPVETRYLGRERNRSGIASKIEDRMADAILRALGEESGSILAFLPGAGEIRRTTDRLDGKLADTVDLAPLYGVLDREAQDRALLAAAPGRRKVVLASAIAETSVTIEGIRVVIDCGLSRLPVFDPASGLTRLETVRVTRASADQRRGRAGRLQPGVCYRLWAEPETTGLLAYIPPEILEADLTALLLTLGEWGVTDPSTLAWLDPPPLSALAEAKTLLLRLGALDDDGRVSAFGKAIADLALPPRLGRMLVGAPDKHRRRLAAEMAAVLTEIGLGGNDPDLEHRLSRFRSDKGARAQAAKSLLNRWISASAPGFEIETARSAGALLALAYPDRVAARRGRPGRYVMANGRGAQIDPALGLAAEPYLVIADAGGTGPDLTIRLAAAMSREDIDAVLGDQIEERVEARFETDTKRVVGRRVTRLGAAILEEMHEPKLPPNQITTALLSGVQTLGIDLLPWSASQMSLRQRLDYLKSAQPNDWPDVSDTALTEALHQWLGPVLNGLTETVRSLDGITPGHLGDALTMLVPYDVRNKLESEAPEAVMTPAGARRQIDYGAEAGPTVSVRVQELYGLDRHPTAGGRALVLELLSPAQRPIQTTRDLPGFWRGSWADVRRDMRGRYPKHDWPEQPWLSVPHRGHRKRS